MLARLLALLFAILPLLVGPAQAAQHLCGDAIVEATACCCKHDAGPGIGALDTCCEDLPSTTGVPMAGVALPPPLVIAVSVATWPPQAWADDPGFRFVPQARPPPRTPLFLRLRTLLV